MKPKNDAVVTIIDPDGHETVRRVEPILGDPDRMLCVLLDEHAARGEPRFAEPAKDDNEEAA